MGTTMLSKMLLGLAVGAAITVGGAVSPLGERVEPPVQSWSSGSEYSSQTVVRDSYGVTEAPYDTYEIVVDEIGHQAEIDACRGPVYSDYGVDGVSVGEHNYCGGDWLLGADSGDHVVVEGGIMDGVYEIVGVQDVPQVGTSASVLGGGVWLQTCYWEGGYMRLAQVVPLV